jgi:hypothetical protein
LTERERPSRDLRNERKHDRRQRAAHLNPNPTWQAIGLT